MKVIHLLLDNGQQSAHPEPQVRALLNEGAVSPETYFWQEGMPEWRPLSELPPRSTIAPPPRGGGIRLHRPRQKRPVAPPLRKPEPGSGRRKHYLRNSLGLVATVTVILLAVCLGATLLNLHCDLKNLINGATDVDTTRTYFRHKVWAIVIYLIVLGLALVPYCIWVHRAHLNCRSLANTTRFTSGWAVAYYFIPFVCFVRPYQVMQEIWKVSQRPAASHIRKDSLLVLLWWILWITTLVSTPFVWSHFDDRHDPDLIRQQVISCLIVDIGGLLLFSFLIAIVIIVTRRQHLLSQMLE